jgi:hypothetical protein
MAPRHRRLNQLGVAVGRLAGLEEEPHAPFGFVYPGFEQTRARYIVMLVTKTVSLAHSRRQLDVVLAQFLQHLGRGDVIGVIVQNAL